MSEFLDPSLHQRFREKFNRNRILVNDSKYKACFFLCCAIADRLDSCIPYLNKHSEPPKTEEDFLVFLMFSCMVIDGIKNILNELSVAYKYETKKELNPINNPEYFEFFKDTDLTDFYADQEKKYITDDRFFEYVRSLAFAHPFKTNRIKELVQTGEKQYAPWVIVKGTRNLSGLRTNEDVGVRIYSSKENQNRRLIFSFTKLKEYISSRYLLLENTIKKIDEITQIQEKKWRERIIEKNNSPITILEECKRSLDEQYRESENIEMLIDFLKIELIEDQNFKRVNEYREKIIALIPDICSAIEKLDYELLDELFEKILFSNPMPEDYNINYHLNKISLGVKAPHERILFCSSVDFLCKEFGSNWVTIDIENMTISEMQLLISVACFFEKMKNN